MYTILTIGLVFLSTFILLPKFKSFTEHYSLSINYFLTLVATLVGVLLAIAITNHEADKKEKQDFIKLLHSSISSVEACYEYTENIIKEFEQLTPEDAQKTQFYAQNQPPYPNYLDTFLMQNIVSKNLSSNALSDLNEQIINLKIVREKDANIYLSFLGETRNILSLELLYQQGKIDSTEFEKRLGELGLQGVIHIKSNNS